MKTRLMTTTRFLMITCFVLSLLLLSGCPNPPDPDDPAGIQGPLNKAIAALNVALSRMGNTSEDWQKILEDTRKEIPAELQSTVGNEVSNTLTRATGAAGTQALCILDIVRNRTILDLRHIRAGLLKKIGVKVEDPEPEPWLCQPNPTYIDPTLVASNRLNQVEFFGYDFDKVKKEDYQVLLVNNSGTIDVSAHLTQQSHYHMTLNLGANGVQLSPDSQKIVLKWKGKQQSEIPMIYPQTPICGSREESKPLDPIVFTPPHTGRGDKDFDGNGPRVSVSVKLLKAEDGSHVDAEIFMEAVETKKDWTTVSGSVTQRIYTPDPGWKVEQITGVLEDSDEYVDTTDKQNDFRPRGSGGPVLQYEFVGDTKGDEASLRTQVTVNFNPLRLVLKQTGNCVSAFRVLTLKRQNLLSPQTVQRLEPRLRSLPPALRSLKESTSKLPHDTQKRSGIAPRRVEVSCCGNY